MIFLTVGTERFPFDRLVATVDQALVPGGPLAGEQVVAQTGPLTFVPRHFPVRSLVPFPEMVDLLTRSEVIVAHAGVGTVLLALKLGRVPIVMPRLAALGEHLDDHQLEFARRLAELCRVLVAFTPEELIETIQNYSRRVGDCLPPGPSAERRDLVAALRNLTGRPFPRGDE